MVSQLASTGGTWEESCVSNADHLHQEVLSVRLQDKSCQPSQKCSGSECWSGPRWVSHVPVVPAHGTMRVCCHCVMLAGTELDQLESGAGAWGPGEGVPGTGTCGGLGCSRAPGCWRQSRRSLSPIIGVCDCVTRWTRNSSPNVTGTVPVTDFWNQSLTHLRYFDSSVVLLLKWNFIFQWNGNYWNRELYISIWIDMTTF